MATVSPSDAPRRPLLARRAANTVRFSVMNVFLVSGMVSMAVGGGWMWYGLLMTFFLVGFVEEWMGDASNKEDMPPVWYMDLMLWLTLPLLLILTVFTLNTIVPNGVGFLDPVIRFFGIDPDAARANSHWFDMTGGLVSLGMFYGVSGFIVAHELVHRTERKFSLFVGRCLLALNWDTGFSIEHVYGHHKNVATELDPASARRGEYIATFAIRSTLGQIKAAYEFEKARMQRRKIPAWQVWQNRFWRGQLITLSVIAFFVWFAGPIGILYSAFAASIGKFYLEMVNYIEHYGLVRIPGTRVEARHSWDSHRRVSNGVFYQLPLHSNHHTFATKPFWELQPQPNNEAPMLPMGYLPTIFMAFFPQIWNVVSRALLADWDKRLASPAERKYLEERGLLLG